MRQYKVDFGVGEGGKMRKISVYMKIQRQFRERKTDKAYWYSEKNEMKRQIKYSIADSA